MRKLKLLLVAGALLLGAGQTWAQTDVTNTYLTNADFSSTTGWTAVTGGGSTYNMGNGQIGSDILGGRQAATVDAIHLSTEYCLGFSCRWNSVYTAYQQETQALPVGYYELSYDVEDTNSSSTKINYQNHFYVKVGETKIEDASTEWMNAKESAWTTHTIAFNIAEASTATISLGYGNNENKNTTPNLYVSHLKLYKYADMDTYLRIKNGLADATAMAPVVTNFVINGTFDNGINPWQRTGTYQNNQTAQNKQGAFTGNFYENWNGDAQANKMYQTITNIPNGTYRLDIAAFVNNLADPNESQFVFANNDKVYLTATDPTAYEVYTVVTNNQIKIGLEQTTATANWMGIDNVSLRYYGPGDVINDAKNAAHKLAWLEAKAAAEAALNNTAYANVIGSEKTALQTEVGKTEPTTADGYDAAAAALTSATAAFIAAAPAYDALKAEIAYAKTIAVNTTTAEAEQNNEATAETVTAATQDLKVLEYTTITNGYKNDVSGLLGEWKAGDYGTTTGQGYIGNESYFDKWNGSAMDLSSSATVTLPAGKYVVKVAGRGVTTTTMSLSVKVGEAAAVSTPFLMIGDTGKGIDTSGATNFSDGGTYSNSNNGRGWQYRYITFETDGTADVTIAINGHLNNGTWQSFYAPVLLCDDATFTAAEKAAVVEELRALLAEGDALVEKYKNNNGAGVFQIPATAYSTFKGKVATGHTFDNETAIAGVTVEQLKQAKELVENGIAAFKATVLNAPAEGQMFTVSLASGEWTYKQGNVTYTLNKEAMTYLANGRTDAGNYNIQYKEVANENLAQAFTFTQVEGNKYKMSQIDADGNARYISTGVPYGGNTGQIRTTTDADKALIVEVIPTAEKGICNLYNTEAKQYIGAQDAGVYTVNSHINFAIAETQKPSITIGASDGGYATTMVPFAVATMPNGLKAYSCKASEGSVLTLTEVTALEANKPYIVEGTAAEVTGDAQGTALTYTEGWLTGVYAETPATEGSYVLQEQNDVIGFYQVVEGKQPTIGANHAYLTVASQSAGVRAFFFDGTTTGISALQMLLDGNCEFYDLNGVRTQQLQKGMNIIRTQDGTTRKIMVK